MTTSLALKTPIEHSNANYHKVKQESLDQLRQEHAWIAEPLIRASDAVKEMPFFTWLRTIQTPGAFGESAKQLYFHSATFPKVMGLMLAVTPFTENAMMHFYAKHAYGEADHYELLTQWMLRHGIIKDRRELEEMIVTPETNACINLAYQLALEQDREKWIVEGQ